MLQDDIKVSNVSVSKDCLKKLKIISIQKDIKLSQLIKDILERSVSKKNILDETEQN